MTLRERIWKRMGKLNFSYGEFVLAPKFADFGKHEELR